MPARGIWKRLAREQHDTDILGTYRDTADLLETYTGHLRNRGHDILMQRHKVNSGQDFCDVEEDSSHASRAGRSIQEAFSRSLIRKRTETFPYKSPLVCRPLARKMT